MATLSDERFMYLRFEHGLSRPQMNNLINRVMEENEEALVNSKDKDNLLYDLVVGELSGSAKESSIPNSTEANKEADTNSNEGWYVYMVSHDEVMASYTDGAFRDYAGYKCINNFDGVSLDEWNNYILKRGAQQKLIDFMMGEADKEFGGKVPASRTVKKHVKEMLENDIPLMKVEKYNGKVYYKFRNCIDGKYFVRIPYEQLRDLVICTNGKMIKLYVMVCAILQNNDCGTTKHHKITRDHLAKKLGLNGNNRQLLGEIGQMLNGLCRLGFLECLETVETSKDGNTYKIIHSYRRLSLEEYREASKRGTKTITK